MVGPNGEGKTNLLEAMHYLLTLTTPRVSADATLIADGSEVAYVRGETQGLEGRTLIEIELRRVGANRLQVNRSPVRRRRDLRKHVRAVFFGPHDLRVVQGEPGARRDFMDEALRSLWPPRESVLNAYDRVLRQRNRLLKDWQGGGKPPGLDTWSEELAGSGADVIQARLEVVDAIAEAASGGFEALSGDGMDVAYTPNIEGGQDPEEFRRRLTEREQDELVRRITLAGPHRDDMRLGVKDLVVRGFASHGEAWGAALCLRLGLADAVTTTFRETPLLLVDDPFSALDPGRRDHVAAGLRERGQVLVSVADDADIPRDSRAIWRVRGGRVEVEDAA